MRKHKVIILGLLILGIFVPVIIHASNLGGKIISSVPGVTCSGYTAVNIIGLPGSYAIPNTKTSTYGNKNILGKYTNISNGTLCKIGKDPYIVRGVVRVPFGVSR